jgi:hypothetical protein
MLPEKGFLLFAASASGMALLFLGCASSGVDATSAATTSPTGTISLSRGPSRKNWRKRYDA